MKIYVLISISPGANSKMLPPKKISIKRKTPTTEVALLDAKRFAQNRTNEKTTDQDRAVETHPLLRTRSQHAAANCKINGLNDDCLLEIFSYLPAIELCAVKDTCRRFNALAEYTAKLRYQNVRDFECVPSSDNLKDFAIFMQHFGKYVKGKLVVKTDPFFNAKKLWLLLKHCGTLKELELIGVNIRGLPIHPMKKMLQNLDTLQFKKCMGQDSDYARIINASVNLRSLTAFVNFTGGSDMLLALIARAASNIEEIYFASININGATFVDNVAKLCRLKKLNLLFMGCDNYPIAPAIEALAERNTLKYVLLREVTPNDDLAHALGKLNLHLCFLQTTFAIPEEIRELFAKYKENGFMHGFYNYKFSLSQQRSSNQLN